MEAIDQCSLALEIDPKAVKALYLRGQAHYGARQYDQALADVKAAIILAPKDKNLRVYFDKMNKQQTMQKMFAKGLYDEKEGPANFVKKFDKLPEFDPENAQVFFDIAIGNEGKT